MSADYDLHLDVTSKSRTLKTNSKVRRMNVHVKSKFSECSDFSCYRSNGTLEPMTSSFPAASESLRANPSQAHAYVQPVRPLRTRSFSPVRVQSGKPRYHIVQVIRQREWKTHCLKLFLILAVQNLSRYAVLSHFFRLIFPFSDSCLGIFF